MRGSQRLLFTRAGEQVAYGVLHVVGNMQRWCLHVVGNVYNLYLHVPWAISFIICVSFITFFRVHARTREHDYLALGTLTHLV